ncbi:MAG: acyl-CoA dehydrogenase family protein [Acidimicrobiales bacterium]
MTTLDAARHLADEVLFPEALAIEALPAVPRAQLDALAGAGLYGLYGPAGAGGLDATAPEGQAVTEALAGGCLSVAFVWAQHHHAVRAVAASDRDGLGEEWLGPLCRGQRRAGVAFAGLRRPGPPVLTATPAPGGWRLEGHAPWVSGWGRIDAVHAGARHGDDVVWALVDATASESLSAEPLALAAVNSSATVTLRFSGHFVPSGRVTSVEAFADFRAGDARGLRANGSHALGVADRCCRLLAHAGTDTQATAQAVAAARDRLDEAAAGNGADLAGARAAASLVAVRAAMALVAAGGGRSVLAANHAQRLAREAMFLLVFGQTPDIRAAQLGELLGR